MIHYIALFTALALSGVSGSFSIVGLTTIFAGAYWQILIMGSTLEIAKLVSTSWLYRNWKTAPILIKYYLSVIVIILMLLNAIGVFGFLARAHIEEYSNIQGKDSQEISHIDLSININKAQSDDYQKQIDFIDSATKTLIDSKKTNQALNVETKRREQRNQLELKKQALDLKISELQDSKNKLIEIKKQSEAEIGPIKYVAMLLYNDSSENQVEKAVRIMILLLVAVCDPTAIILLMAANHGLNQKTKKDVLTILETHDNIKDKSITLSNPFE